MSTRRDFCFSFLNIMHTRWAPTGTSYKCNYNRYTWPHKWVTGVITLLLGVAAHLVRGETTFVLSFFWAVHTVMSK